MNRFARSLAVALAVAAAGLQAGCGSSASGLITGSTVPSDGAAGLKNDDPAARPVAVAWTSARARRCGFFFDGPKLRTSYLAWEAKQGAAGEQLAKIERSYDTTYKGTWDKVSAEDGYCSDKKGVEIKADLQRHLAGDYAANLPQAKAAPSCGFFGCPTAQSDEPFDSKKFWQKRDQEKVGR